MKSLRSAPTYHLFLKKGKISKEHVCAKAMLKYMFMKLYLKLEMKISV